jgi:hypothetical protein
MDREYGIFEKLPDESARRHGIVSDLEEAIAKTNALAKLSPNEFYILSTDTQEIVHRVEGTKPAPLIAGAEPETA